MAHIVRGKVLGGPEFDAQQIADRVVVLDAIQPADCDSAWIERRGVVAIELKQDAFQMPHDAAAFVVGQPRSARWRHRARLDHRQHRFPGSAVGHERRVVAIASQIDFRFGLTIAMAGETVFGKQRLHTVGERGQRSRAAFGTSPGRRGTGRRGTGRRGTGRRLGSRRLGSRRLGGGGRLPRARSCCSDTASAACNSGGEISPSRAISRR